MKWFKHDSDANRDAKLEKVLMRYGAEGYGLYWLCLELIAAPIDKTNISFELEHDSEILAFRLKMDTLKVEEIMRFFISISLFETNEATQRITCLKLASRLENSIIKNPQLKEIQQLITVQSIEIPDNPGQSGKTPARLDQIRPDNKDQDQKKGRFAPPSVQEVADYCLERKNNINAQAFIDHYTTNGWMRGKSKIKDWKACVRTWEQTERGNGNGQQDTRSRAKRVSDKLDEIARADIERRGFTDSLD